MHEETIEKWFDLYGQDVFNYLVYYTSSIDVEDLVQETFTKAWIKLRNYGEIEIPRPGCFPSQETRQRMRYGGRNGREVLILRGLEDMSVSATAQILGWSESKVKTTYFRAIRQIQHYLQGGNYNGLVR